MSQLDNYSYFGPDYSYADNIPLPGQIGVRREPSFGAIIDSVAGINFYVDTIAFGGRTFFDQQDPRPMGLRYFMNTDMRCSNGASMSEYFDGVTKGDLLGDHVADALASSGLPGLKGLAPGMLENARDALDPRPILSAVTATGYPVCQQITCPVGDSYGNVQNAQDADKPYIIDPVQYVEGGPTQTRWVQATDDKGYVINITKDEFETSPKCYNADGTYMEQPPEGCPATAPPAIDAADKWKYKLCRVKQRAVMPIAVAEPFVDLGADAEKIVAAVAVAALGGVALWWLSRR